MVDEVKLEEKQADAEAQVADDWRMELESWKDEEARRREEERAVWRAEIDRLENDRIAREFENERQALLERDSLRMNQLTAEISQLKEILSGPQLSEEEQVATEQAVANKENEKAALDSLIEQKLAMLEQAQKEMEGMGGCLFVELATRMVMYVWWLAVRRVRIGTRKAAAWRAGKVLTIAFLMYVIMETNASLSLSG